MMRTIVLIVLLNGCATAARPNGEPETVYTDDRADASDQIESGLKSFLKGVGTILQGAGDGLQNANSQPRAPTYYCTRDPATGSYICNGR
jgi:hypothetical protein